MSKTDDLDHLIRENSRLYAAGAISEAHYEAQDARLRARQSEIRTWREGKPSQPRLPLLAPPRRPLRADLSVRLLRRRGLAYAGMLPPAIAKVFTIGQAAVLSVVAWEHLTHGACRKSYAEIADEAGCSRRWVKATIRLARNMGLFRVDHRPRPGRWKDDTNVVQIVEIGWLSWLKTRRERIEKGQRAASSGGSRVPPSLNGQDKRRGFATKERPPSASESPFIGETKGFRLPFS